MLDEKQIQTLLRLKKYEQPPAEYFENFLQQFQERQRAELLRRPLWRIALDRFHAFAGEYTLTQYATSAATAAIVLVAGLSAINVFLPADSGTLAENTSGSRGITAHSGFSLAAQPPVFDSQETVRRPVFHSAQSSSSPHYVIDARPVSYEPPFSF
jgi:hypothetical protein